MATEQSVLAVIRASRPTFKTPSDKLAFAIHSIFLAHGFNLNATGHPAFSDDALTAQFPDEAEIEGWNEVEENYAFVYSTPKDSSKKVLVKCLVMNKQLFVDALATGGYPLHLEINIDDFAVESEATTYGSQFKELGKFVDLINKELVTKLSGVAAASTSSSTSSERKVEDTDRDQPRGGPYGLEDPYAPFSPYPSGVVMPPVYPSVGRDDLYPQPPPGTFPTRGGFGDGGMLIGPNNPQFFGGVGGGRMGFPGGQPGVPPGARFDPFGPPDVPGFESNRFTRNPRRPPGGTHPDLEHFNNGSDFI